MPRPKKPRYAGPDGRPCEPDAPGALQLPDNLYPDTKKRLNTWRYLRADGTSRSFKAPTEKAIKLAEEANAIRHTTVTVSPVVPPRHSVMAQVERYTLWREEYDPKLAKKASWKNRCNHLKAFARHFEKTKVGHLTLDTLRPWWEDLTYHQQHARRSEFNKFFNWLAGQGLTPRLEFNPFTTADDRPRLMEKGKPTVKRARLGIDPFWTIYNKAGELGFAGLQIAMGISLVTTMRRADICDLRLDKHVAENSLRKTINKSAAQRDDVYVANLQWKLDEHPMLSKLINRARELSLQHFRCPYIISHKPDQRRTGKTKDHICQVTPDRLSDMFAEVRDACNLFPARSEKYSPPTFHEIRGLSSHIYGKCYDVKQVQELMAHTDERVTKGYQAGHGIEYKEVKISVPAELLGGTF